MVATAMPPAFSTPSHAAAFIALLAERSSTPIAGNETEIIAQNRRNPVRLVEQFLVGPGHGRRTNGRPGPEARRHLPVDQFDCGIEALRIAERIQALEFGPKIERWQMVAREAVGKGAGIEHGVRMGP